MESDIFKAGVRPGSPSSEVEIKMLLCYLLAMTPQPLSFDQIYGSLSEHELVNYFELGSALEKLLSSGHLSVQNHTPPLRYMITDLGSKTADEFEKNIPITLREKAISAAKLTLAREKRLGEVKVSQTPCVGGFSLELTIPEDKGELLSLRMFVPTSRECERLRRNFLNSPQTIYKGIVALLSGDERVLGEIFTKEDKLF